MRRPHGQLRAWLSNTLRRHHTDGLTATDEVPPGQIPAIAGCTDTVTRLAGYRGSDLEMIDVVLFKELHSRFIDHFAGAEERRPSGRVDHGFRHAAAENTILQGNHHFTTLDDGLTQNTPGRAAVIFRDHQVLTDVHQPAGQVTSIRRLDRRIGLSLAGAMGRDKVFVDVQPLTEVRRDRGLNNGAIRFRHQTAHTGKLADLGVPAPGAGIGHHVDGVERFLLDRLAFGVDDFLHAQFVHHFTGDPVTGMGPDIDDFVVAFAIGQQSLAVLLLNRLHLSLSRIERRGLAVRNHHVTNANRNT